MKNVMVTAYASAIAYVFSKWAFIQATAERGYAGTLGGEIFVPPMAFIVAYIIGWEVMKGVRHGIYSYKKRRNRKTTGI